MGFEDWRTYRVVVSTVEGAGAREEFLPLQCRTVGAMSTAVPLLQYALVRRECGPQITLASQPHVACDITSPNRVGFVAQFRHYTYLPYVVCMGTRPKRPEKAGIYFRNAVLFVRRIQSASPPLPPPVEESKGGTLQTDQGGSCSSY